MAQFEIIMPKMGESIEEATITKWFVNEGDKVVEDDVLLEIATDKVDSEIPSPVEGVVQKIMYNQDDTVAVGSVIAIIDLAGEEEEGDSVEESDENSPESNTEKVQSAEPKKEKSEPGDIESKPEQDKIEAKSGDRFYSPLVRKIASEENISKEELDSIPGSGINGRVQKRDVINYLESRKTKPSDQRKEVEREEKATDQPAASALKDQPKVTASVGSGDEIIEMSRMRKIIADHMINSKRVSAHVTNMIEADVTNIVNWRNRHKDEFQRKEGVKLTYLPLFLEACVKAIKDFPLINSSVDGDKIIVKKNIHLGVAVALPDNNLIVPVIKNAGDLNVTGITRELVRLAGAARSNKLNPDEIQGGTFTVTNFGTFKNTIGTPIINQPQVAILATGAIEKKPAVIETAEGDMIAIRHKMFLSLTYDHRIIDGALGGSYLKKVADYIEGFDVNRSI